ncbi:MAG: hypothetical protein E6G22_02215 [Actinobacteria bacterium]|nr:MAG: hypothetical protein E6G22_02215 [Actinomycetota bacterium]
MMQILVIANETVESDVLRNVLPRSARVLIVAPALNSRLRHWVSDEDEARAAAEERLRRCLERLRSDGVGVAGAVGDADPLQAIADALCVFDADAIVVATHPPGRSNWLARDLVARARRRFDRPVVHVVVDAARGREYVREAA